jgi:hypothetical protein
MDDGELDALLQAYRRHTQLSSSAEARILARLRSAESFEIHGERHPSREIPLRWIAIGLAVAAALALLWLRPSRLGIEARHGPDAAAHVADASSVEHEVAPPHEPMPTGEPRDVDPRDGGSDEAHSEQAPAPEHDRASGRDTTRPPARDRGARSKDPPEPSDALAAEAALLRRANALLSGGDAARALALLQDWERTFAPGHLYEEHAALRSIALCVLGRTIQGRGEAKAFGRRYPASAHLERVRSACADAGEKNPTGESPAGQ